MNLWTEETMESCINLLSEAKHVEVDADRLEQTTYSIALNDFELPAWDIRVVYPTWDEPFVSQCFWMNVINFCYGSCWPNGTPNHKIDKFAAADVTGKMWSGAMALQAIFYKIFGEGVVTPQHMRVVAGSLSQFKRNFQGKSSYLPMLRKRYEMLSEAIEVLEGKFGGNPMNILRQGNYRAFSNEDGKPGVVQLLIKNFPKSFGMDFTKISGIGNFYFYKRAQLFALIYHDRAIHSDGRLEPLADPEDIGPIVDYQLPKSYLADEVFHYRSWLRWRIEKTIPLREHSLAETEIRAATFWAHVQELRMINEQRDEADLPPIHVGHLDYYRWMRGRKAEGNHHLCLTTNY